MQVDLAKRGEENELRCCYHLINRDLTSSTTLVNEIFASAIMPEKYKLNAGSNHTGSKKKRIKNNSQEQPGAARINIL